MYFYISEQDLKSMMQHSEILANSCLICVFPNGGLIKTFTLDVKLAFFVGINTA